MKTSHVNRFRQIASTSVATISMVGLAVSGLAGLAAPTVYAANAENFQVNLQPLNNSGVTGTAHIVQQGNNLRVTIDANGLVPNEPHAQHIHGMLNNADAECPTLAQDANHDGVISVDEGAATYGPIKLNLTSPQTPFGPNPAAINGVNLFAPFAGVPSPSGFPVALSVGENGSHSGVEHFQQNYTFDVNDPQAAAALASLTPLTKQEIVIHGDMVPNTMNAQNGETTVYNPLQPVACGEITTANGNDTMDTNGNMSTGGDMGNQGNNATPAPQQTAVPVTNNTAITDSLNAQLTAAQSALSQGLSTQQLSTTAAMQSALNAYTAHTQLLMDNFNVATQAATVRYNASIAAGTNRDEARNQLINSLSSARDLEVGQLTEARNQLIDQYNQSGTVSERDSFLANFDQAVDTYRNAVEQAKNQL